MLKKIFLLSILLNFHLFAENKPNFILILADDLGFADVGYHGCKDVPTPHIDALAKQGVKMTQGYANAAVCSPTRAAILTGRYQHRFGCEYHIGPRRRSPEATIGLPLNEKTIAERLKPHAYVTAHIGKWHLGGELQNNKALMPPSRGFDEFFGILEGASLYNDVHNRERKYRRGFEIIDHEPEYYTDALGREAISFIKRNQDKPFFLYLPFNAPHAPRQAKAEHMKKFKNIEDIKRREFAGMLYSMDENIGRIMQTLKDLKIEENTAVIFLSDNGGKPNDNASLNHPLRGEKNGYFEGGIRVPFCIKWPAKIKADSRYHYPTMSMDLFPFILENAGVNIPNEWNIEGKNFLTHLNSNKRLHDELFWKSGQDFSVRHKDWKLLKQDGQFYLFDLSIDPNETNNQFSMKPELVSRLQELYKKWDTSNIPPNYGHDPVIGPRVERVHR